MLEHYPLLDDVASADAKFAAKKRNNIARQLLNDKYTFVREY